MAIIGFGNVGVFTACRFLKDGYSVCVYDLKVDSTRIQQIIYAELPRMLNGITFGLHLKQYTASELDMILKRFSVLLALLVTMFIFPVATKIIEVVGFEVKPNESPIWVPCELQKMICCGGVWWW